MRASRWKNNARGTKDSRRRGAAFWSGEMIGSERQSSLRRGFGLLDRARAVYVDGEVDAGLHWQIERA